MALPQSMTILFSVTRQPLFAAPTALVVGVLLVILGISALAGVVLSREPGPRVDKLQRSAFFSWASAGLLVCLQTVHVGVADWTLVTGPGFWLLAPGVLGMGALALTSRLCPAPA